MQVSSNSLYHFTNSDALKNILSNSKMSGSYCCEQIVYSENSDNIIIVPMICFCDIPLETYIQLKVETYGNFGIALKKTWGFRNKLNPVLYIDTNSTVAEKFRSSESSVVDLSKDVADQIFKLESEINKTSDNLGLEPNKPYNAFDLLGSDNLIPQVQKENNEYKAKIENLKNQNAIPKLFLHLLEFIKPYQGDLKREDKIITDYRFYDEMEWRYVPNRNGFTPNIQIGDLEKFKEWRNQYEEKPLLFSLDFEFNDIDEIVVEKNTDVEDFKSFIYGLDNTHFSSEQKEGLCSKIISIERLKNTIET
jgi:Putative abortive phage resistance protein AbiGi, antitoxin